MNNINIPEQAKSNVNEFKNYFKEIDVMNLRGVELLDFIDIKQYYIQKEQLNEIGKAFNNLVPFNTRKTKNRTENWFFRNNAPRPKVPHKSQALKYAKEKQRAAKAAQQQAEVSAAPYTNTPQPGYSYNQNA
jgi:hypothetical protein